MNRKKIIAEARAKEIEANNLQYIWMSFCGQATFVSSEAGDPDMPAGEHFLGVIITKAYGPADAMCKTQELGINPGGEIQSFVFPESSKFKPEHIDRLMSKDDLIAADFISADNINDETTMH